MHKIKLILTILQIITQFYRGGDIYAALRDCQIALLLDPEHIKSHFRLAKCLFDIGRPSDAQKVLTRFQRIFKEFKTNSACKALRKDIEEALNAGEFFIALILAEK